MSCHIGHKKIIDIFKKQIQDDNLHQAYFLIGSENIGKLNLAKYFALLIHAGREDQKIKTQIDQDIHPDTFTIYPIRAKKTVKRSISIEQIHQLLKKTSLSPHSSKWKVGIISDAHLMTQEAANAFLKTLEEPTKSSIFILTSSDEKLILPTIASRCQKLFLGLVNKNEITKDLIVHGLDVKSSQLIASLSAGRPGLAKRFLDKERLESYNQDLILLEKLIEASDVERLLIAQSIAERQDILRVLDIWLIFLRDLLAAENDIFKIIVNVNRMKKLIDFSKKISSESIKKNILKIYESKQKLLGNANPRLVLENLALQLSFKD
jgi:DNA polymerase-3 subunit delta'